MGPQICYFEAKFELYNPGLFEAPKLRDLRLLNKEC